jgi:uncharacterized repeat protein (TIGR03803 family)
MSVPFVSSRSGSWLAQACLIVCACLLLTPAAGGSTAKILFSPKPTQGAHFWGIPAFDSAGNLYGTAQEGGVPGCGPQHKGCGTIFQLSPKPDGSWTPQVIYTFQGGADGDLIYAGVIPDGAGNLFGTTAAGGDKDYGTAYELSPGVNGWTKTLLHSFASKAGDGEYPGPLTFDQSGNLYGTSYVGVSPCDQGTVFQLSPNPQGEWTENRLHCFLGTGGDGGYLNAPVIFDPAGNLYSTTYLGGANGTGTVFELSPSGGNWTETILYSFGRDQLVDSWPPLVLDKKGNLYGVIYGGIFQLTPSGGGWNYSTIYTTQPGPHGVVPNSLIMDAAGNLYGTAEGGASSNCDGGGCGAVFKLTQGKKGWHMTVLYDFPGGAGGEDPFGGLVMDHAGNLYGTTYHGGRRGCGNGCGVVFKIIP